MTGYVVDPSSAGNPLRQDTDKYVPPPGSTYFTLAVNGVADPNADKFETWNQAANYANALNNGRGDDTQKWGVIAQTAPA